MEMKTIEFERVVSYLMENIVEDTERDFDTKKEILCEELINSFDIKLEDNKAETTTIHKNSNGSYTVCLSLNNYMKLQREIKDLKCQLAKIAYIASH